MRPGTPADPTDVTLPADVRLIAARAILTRHVRAADLQQARAKALKAGTEDPLASPDAPHKTFYAGRPGNSATPFDDDVGEDADDEIDDLTWELGGPELIDRTDPNSGRTARGHPAHWPQGTTYGSEEDWPQLQWRPYWFLDQGQRWMDRFELGETWWQAIYADERFNTERKFEVWRKNANNGCRGVVWAGPTWDGRSEEPALAVVVVASQRRPHRSGTWPLFLPNPAWSPAARQHYITRRQHSTDDWRKISHEASTLDATGIADPYQVARTALRARLEARRQRRQ